MNSRTRLPNVRWSCIYLGSMIPRYEHDVWGSHSPRAMLDHITTVTLTRGLAVDAVKWHVMRSAEMNVFSSASVTSIDTLSPHGSHEIT